MEGLPVTPFALARSAHGKLVPGLTAPTQHGVRRRREMLQPITVSLAQFCNTPSKYESHIQAGGFFSINRQISVQLSDDRSVKFVGYVHIEGTPNLNKQFLEATLTHVVGQAAELLSKLPTIEELSQAHGSNFYLNEDYGSGSFTWCKSEDGINIEWVHPRLAIDA